MITIVLGHELDDAAAASYLRARAAGLPAGITSAWRSPAEQEALFRARYTTNYAASAKKDPRVWQGRTWWRRIGADAAAPPGAPYSRHETGLALDLPAGGPREWMTAHGAAYGWIAGRVAGEPWHFEYDPARDTFRNVRSWFDMATIEELRTVVREEVTAALTERSRQDEVLLYRAGTGQIVLVGPKGVRTVRAAEWSVLADLGYRVDRDNLTPAQLSAVIAAHGGA